MAIAWLLKDPRITSVLVGVRSVNQLDDNLKTLNNLDFSEEELKKIDNILKEK
jgi:L-glyceraldehyde 3-phosphate reductase